jgi:hypothetical protein
MPKISYYFFACFFLILLQLPLNAQEPEKPLTKLDNPLSVQYLQTKLRKKAPRLVATPEQLKTLKNKLKTDLVIQNIYTALRLNADSIQAKPLLERVVVGRRLLSTSREMLYRMNTLGLVYAVEKDKKLLNRINDEVIAVCNFSDWNPSHYLDVAEMCMAVASALDWTAGDLPAATITLAQKSLIEKGINPSYNPKGNVGWINNRNNWNQVCNGGMIAASLAIAETDPALAAKTISRALDGMPNALAEYAPDGVYPEGATYWSYGTSYSVLTSMMLENAFGTDFGLAAYPAFLESATFYTLSMAPSGMFYNFADCGDDRGKNGDFTLAWFANKTGNARFFEKERFLIPAKNIGKISYLAGPGIIWLAHLQANKASMLPTAWKGEGANPVVIFTGGENDPHQYYFGGKGGRGTVNHGNMDGGSFIFELNGVRWSVDPGNQNYHDLEKTGFNLWASCQNCQRWTLLTKNNYGHSTLTVNDALHVVNGMAKLTDFKNGAQPEATFDLTPTFAGQLKNAQRRFVKNSAQSLLIEDDVTTDTMTKMVAWQMLTTAEVELVKGGAILKQAGKKLKINNLSHPNVSFSVVSLYPAPLQLDRQMEGLKRLEIRIPAYLFENGKGKIAVQLTGD